MVPTVPCNRFVRMYNCRGGATVVKVGGTISRAERAKIFFDPHLWLTWGDMKQDIAVFFTAIMTSDLD